MTVWFTGDTHYNHSNIVRGASVWEDRKTRNFDTVEEHNQKLVDNINSVVRSRDIIYHVGDWSFGGVDKIYEFRKQIECKNIYLIYGNHDHHIKNNRIVSTGNGFINAQNLFVKCEDILEKRIGGHKFVLCHYSMRTWHHAYKGVIQLYGHTHGDLENYTLPDGSLARTMDVGIDTHPEFRPYNIEEVVSIMNERTNLKHHK